ncbi:hypothetical protein L6R52_11535 [Myxococcota bacterium]|nr:hypothetical protein [Myxococcota bacterium]
MSRFTRWFYKFTAVYFIVTAVTAIPLYFREGNGRPGLYGDTIKEWLVMLHNGEWLSYVLTGNPLWSGLVIGGALAWALVRFALHALRRPAKKDGEGAREAAAGD